MEDINANQSDTL